MTAFEFVGPSLPPTAWQEASRFIPRRSAGDLGDEGQQQLQHVEAIQAGARTQQPTNREDDVDLHRGRAGGSNL